MQEVKSHFWNGKFIAILLTIDFYLAFCAQSESSAHTFI